MEQFTSYKLKLLPTEQQKVVLDKYFGMARFIFNYGIYLCENKSKYDNYYCMPMKQMAKYLTELKEQEEYRWLNDFNRFSMNATLLELQEANQLFLDGKTRKPKYRRKKSCKQHFQVRPDRLKIFKNKVRISEGNLKLGDIRCIVPYDNIIGNGDDRIKSNRKKNKLEYRRYRRTFITYDGKDYYISFSINIDLDKGFIPTSMKNYLLNEDWMKKESSDVVGIDVGCKKNNWIVDSKGGRVSRPDTRKKEKRLKRNQGKFSRQLDKMKKSNSSKKELSNNAKKTLYQCNKDHRAITNMKLASIYNYTSDLIKSKPKAVCMEDIKVNELFIHDNSLPTERKHDFNRTIKSAMMYTIRTIVEKKCNMNNIPFFLAEPDFPSSQLCSNCGYRQDIGKKRIYRCPSCGMVIDRDLNAAYNLQINGIAKLHEYRKEFVHFGIKN